MKAKKKKRISDFESNTPTLEFKPRLLMSMSTGRLTWSVGPGKEESWWIDGMNVDEIVRLERHKPREAYNKAKKWRLNV